MKFYFTLVITLFFYLGINAQHGINTLTPKATLDIASSSKFTPTNKDGLLIPTMLVFPATNPTSQQDGMLIYINGENVIPAKGFYYWDSESSSWRVFNDRPSGTSNVTNGLTSFNGIARLGGNLTQKTIINQNDFDFEFRHNGTEDFKIMKTSTLPIFSVNGSDEKVFVNGTSGPGNFNVDGTSYFSNDLHLWNNNLSSQVSFLRMYEETNSGVIDFTQGGAVNHRIHATNETVFNENGTASAGIRIESLNNENIFRVDAGTSKVSIGTPSGLGTFNVTGESWLNGRVVVRDNVPNGNLLVNLGVNGNSGDGQLQVYNDNSPNIFLSGGGTSIFNSQNLTNADFRIESKDNQNMFYLDSSENKVSIGALSGSADFNVNGDSNFSNIVRIKDQVESGGNTFITMQALTNEGSVSLFTNNVLNHSINSLTTTFFNATNNINSDFRIGSISTDNMFSVDSSTDAVSVGTNSGPGEFNVLGTSYFNKELILRDSSLFVGDDLIRMTGSNDDGIMQFYSDNNLAHFIHSNAITSFNINNNPNADFRIGSADSDYRFYVNSQTNRVSIGTFGSAGTFNVEGTSFFSNDIYLRDGAVNSGDILVRMFDSNDDGVFEVLSDDVLAHRIWRGTTIFNDQRSNSADFVIKSISSENMFFVDTSFNRVGINTTAVNATLSVNGTASKTGGGSWSTFSDRKLKTNISSYEEGLDFITKVNLVNYQFNDKYFRDFGESPEVRNKVFQGVIAQDLQKIAPDMVTSVKLEESEVIKPEDDNSPTEIIGVNAEYLQVDPSKFTYALINSVKELNAKNEKLEAKVSELETRLNKIEALLNK